MVPEGKKIILFDGVCNLCNGAVQFILKRDKNRIFRYASLQSDIGKRLMTERGIPEGTMDSILLIDPQKAYYYKSTAAIKIGQELAFPYPLMAFFLVIPESIRDLVYNWVAKNRYRWFGKSNSCMLPSKETKSLFLD